MDRDNLQGYRPNQHKKGTLLDDFFSTFKLVLLHSDFGMRGGSEMSENRKLIFFDTKNN